MKPLRIEIILPPGKTLSAAGEDPELLRELLTERFSFPDLDIREGEDGL